ncbi:MAG: LamG-like jellyroll fold domain-containing protein [Candidatus Hodarchaeales archaeon]
MPVKDYSTVSFNMRVVTEGTNPINVGINYTDDSNDENDYWYEITTVDGRDSYEMDLFLFLNSLDEPIDYHGTINSLDFDIGDGEVYIDNVTLGGLKGLLLYDDMEYATKDSNYSDYTLTSTYFSDHWIIKKGTATTFEITADANNMMNSVTQLDLTKINSLLVGVEGTGYFTLNLQIYHEDGTHSQTKDDYGNKTLSGWGIVDEFSFDVTSFNTDGERYIAFPEIVGEGSMVFGGVIGITDSQNTLSSSPSGDMTGKGLMTFFNDESEKDEWSNRESVSPEELSDDFTGGKDASWSTQNITGQNSVHIEDDTNNNLRQRLDDMGDITTGYAKNRIYQTVDFDGDFTVTLTVGLVQGSGHIQRNYIYLYDESWTQIAYGGIQDSWGGNAKKRRQAIYDNNGGDESLYVSGIINSYNYTYGLKIERDSGTIYCYQDTSSPYNDNWGTATVSKANNTNTVKYICFESWQHYNYWNDNWSNYAWIDDYYHTSGGGSTPWSISDGEMVADNTSGDSSLNLNELRNDYTNNQISTVMEFEEFGTVPEAGIVVRHDGTNYAVARIMKESSTWKAKLKLENGGSYTSEVDLGFSLSLDTPYVVNVVTKDNNYVELNIDGKKYDISPPGTSSLPSSGKVGLYSSNSKVSYADFTLSDLSYDNASQLSTFKGITKGLVGMYKLDEESGTTAYDSSGYKNHGDITGATIGLSGKVDRSYSFDGSGDHITLSSNPDISGDITYNMWITVDNQVDGFLIDARDANDDGVLFRLLDTDKLMIQYNSVDTESSSTLNYDEWYMVSMVTDKNANTQQIYINGVADGSSGNISGQTIDITTSMRIGARSHTSPSNYYDGNIDDFRIYNRSLTVDEITTLYNNTSSIYTDASPEPMLDLALIKTKNPDYPANISTAPQYLVFDQSGNDFNAKAVGDAHFNVVEGAYEFNGTYDYLEITNASSSILSNPTGNDITWSFTAKSLSTSGDHYAISTGGQTSSTGFAAGLNSSEQMWIGIKTESSKAVTGYTIDLSDGDWHNFHVTFNGSATSYLDQQMLVYMDGELIGTYDALSGTYTNSESAVIIGKANNVNEYYWYGYIESVEAWDCILTHEQILGELGSGVLISEGKQLITNENPVGNVTSWVMTALVNMTDEYPTEGDGSGFGQDSLDLFWKHEETSGDALDESDNSYDGSVIDAARGESGKFGNAYKFDLSSNAKVQVEITDNNLDFTQADGFSIGCWFKTYAAVTSNQALFGIRNSTCGGSDTMIVAWLQSGNNLFWRIRDDNATSGYINRTKDLDGTGIDTDDGNWHHVMIVRGEGTSATSYLYVDGEQQDSVSNPSGTYSFDVHHVDIAVDQYPHNSYRYSFNGWIDEFTIFSEDLSSTEVGDIFDNGYNLGGNSGGTSIASITLDNDDIINVNATLNGDNQYSLNADDGSETYDLGTYHYSGLSETVLSMPLTHLTRTKDNSSYGNDGTLNGNPVWDAEGLYFDGSNDYISTDSNLPTMSTWTVTAWIKPESWVGNYETIVYADNNAYPIILKNFSGDWKVGIYNDVYSDTELTIGSWYNIITTCDGTTGKVYVNGVLKNSGSCSLSLSGDIKIGGWGYTSEYFKGTISNVSILNRVLNEREIMEAGTNFGTYNDGVAESLSINVETNKDPKSTPDLLISVSNGLDYNSCSIPITTAPITTRLKQISFGDEESTSEMAVFSYEVTPIDPVVIRPLVSDPRTSIELEPWAAQTIGNMRVYANEIYGDTNSTGDEFGFEINNLDELDVGGKYLIASVKVTNNEKDGKFAIKDMGPEPDITYTWDITKEPQFNQLIEIHPNEWQTVIIPVGSTSPSTIRFYVYPDSAEARDMGLEIGDFTIASQEELEGSNTYDFSTTDSDRVVHQQNGYYSHLDLGTVNGNANDSTWDITGFDYPLTDKTILSFDYRLDTELDEQVIAKLSIHGDEWYNIEFAKTDDFSINNLFVNGTFPTNYPNVINEWKSVTIPIKDFYAEYYYQVEPSGTIDKIRLTINENSQNCVFGLHIANVWLYEPQSFAGLMKLGQDLKDELEDSSSGKYVNEWIASPLYPVSGSSEEMLPKVNFVKNGSFEEFTRSGDGVSVANWSDEGDGGKMFLEQNKSTDGKYSFGFIGNLPYLGDVPSFRQTIYPAGGRDVKGIFEVSFKCKLSDVASYMSDCTIKYGTSNSYIHVPVNTLEWTTFSKQISITASGVTSIVLDFAFEDNSVTAYFDEVTIRTISDDSSVEYANIRTFEPEKIAQGGPHSRLALVDGWFSVYDDDNWVDVDKSIDPLYAKGIIGIQHIQYYYTDIFVEQPEVICNDWEFYIDRSANKTGPWYLWINGVFKGAKDTDPSTWSNLTLVSGINNILMCYVSDNTNNEQLNFKSILTGLDANHKFIVAAPPESKTRQLAVHYDPQYQSKWITRASDPETNNLEDGSGNGYKKSAKKLVDLPFNEGEGSYSKGYSYYALESEYNNYNAILYDATWTSDGLLSFDDGDDSYVKIESYLPYYSTGGGGSRTIALWIKPSEVGNLKRYLWNRGVTVGGASYNNGHQAIYIDEDGKLVYGGSIDTYGKWEKTYDADIQANEWYHIAYTHDLAKNLIKLYINGEWKASWTQTEVPLTQDPIGIIGGYWNVPPAEPTGTYSGIIKEFGYWDYALTVDEITQVVMNTHFDSVEDNVALIRDGINANLMSINMPATIMNTVRLQQYMQTERNMYRTSNNRVLWHPFGQVLFTSDVLPDDIWNGATNESMMEQYLEQGGKVVLPGGYPAFGIHCSKAEPIGSDDYVGTGSSYQYDGALGHQYIFDIEDNNNSNSGVGSRGTFSVGLIAYDEGTEYMDDDFDNNGDVINFDYPWAPGDDENTSSMIEGNNNFDAIKYSQMAGQNPAFTVSPWTRLKAHVILGKHEYDTEYYHNTAVPSQNNWEVVDIDGYSYVDDRSQNANHKNATGVDTSGGVDYTRYVDYCNEIGTDPMDMGLWFKPYLADTNGAIEEDFNTDEDNNYYLEAVEEVYEGYKHWKYNHHELWNVGTGSIQAGANGRGIVSLLPMFSWDDPELSLTGTNYEHGDPESGTDSQEYGIFSDRGLGGIINTPASRDVARGMLGMAVGTMMLSIALDNVTINALTDNQTNAYNNILAPDMENNNANDKYPYTQGSPGDDDLMALRNNGMKGPTGNQNSYGSYPIWTGDYNKWAFENDVSSTVYTEETTFDAGDSINQLVYEGSHLMTTIALETGDYQGEVINPYQHTQYLSVENLRYDGSNSVNLYTGVSASTTGGNSNTYATKLDIDDNEIVNVGVRWESTEEKTHKGQNEPSGGYDDTYEWDIYPQLGFGDEKSPAVSLSRSLEQFSGWGSPDKDIIEIEDDSQREIILRSPLVNLYNNQKFYEHGLSVAQAGETIVPRGGTGTSNYGATMAWSPYSPLILFDKYDISDDTAQEAFNITSGDEEIYWQPAFRNRTTFEVDGINDGIAYASGGGQTKDCGGDGAVQWLSSGPDDIVALEHDDSSYDKVTVDLIRITPALNCYWNVPQDIYDDPPSDHIYAKIPSIKKIRVRLIEDYEGTEETVVRSWDLELQKWQTTDVVLQVNPSLTEEDAVILDDGSAIVFQILEVWNEDYRDIEGDQEVNIETITDNAFGGIAEVYLYGNTYTTGNYNDIGTTIEQFTLPEDAIRYNDAETEWAYDGGTYFLDEGGNDVQRRSMNGGTYQVTISAGQNDEDIGGLRFNADQGIIFRTTSIDIDHVMIGEWQKEMAQQENEFWVSLVTNVLATIALSVIAVALMASIKGLPFGLAVAARTITTVGAIISGLITLQNVLYIFGAYEAAAFVSSILVIRDVIIGGLIHGVAELLDFQACVVGTILSGSQYETHWYRETLQPLAYGIYMVTLDLRGTSARLVQKQSLKAFTGVTEDEIEMIMFYNFERKLMAGEAFNFCDLSIYFNNEL